MTPEISKCSQQIPFQPRLIIPQKEVQLMGQQMEVAQTMEVIIQSHRRQTQMSLQ